MSDKRPPLLDNRQSSTSSIQSNTSTGGGGSGRDTSSNDELQHQPQQQQQHQKPAHHHQQQHQRTHKKQFVVGGAHSRHHTRVPSYGRGLNKLGKLMPLETSPVKGAGSEKVKGGGKKLTFEVDEGGGGGERGYRDEGGQELIEAEVEEVEVVPDRSASGGGGGLVTSGGGVAGDGASATKELAKSPSAKSLDPQPREGVRWKSNPTSRRAGAGEDNRNNKRDRSRSKSREGGRNKKITASSGQVFADGIVEMGSGRGAGGGGGGDAPSTTITSSQQLQWKQQQQHTSQPAPAQSKSQSHNQPQNDGNGSANTQPPTAKELHTHLLPHTKPPSATIPPQVNHESISTHTKIHHTPPPPNAPITPTPSLPNSHDQPLTSRFIDFSNSQGGTSNSISPSSGGGARRSGNIGRGDRAPPSTATPFSTPNPNNSSSTPKTPTDSPSTAPATTTTTIAAKPSRTQQKLWLQRQSSQYELPMGIPPHAYCSQTSYQNPPTHSQSHHHHTYHSASSSHHHSPSAPLSIPLSHATHPARLTKEFERVNREYLNTRRFMNPILDSLERAGIGRNSDRRIPKRGHASDAGGNNMGLSQSLKETGSLRVGGGVRGSGGIGVKDDSAVARKSVAERGRDRERGGDLHVLLMRIWREGELLVSNE